MQKPDVCNADFTGCVDTVEMAKARVKNTQSEEIVTIPGSTAGLFISKSMHESLLAKSVICAPVLENCVKVRDQVFNSFLADSAASLQVAENLAEYNARTNCIKSVSDCFHNACRDNIDPKDPDGSYDACLTRPEMMLTMCKPQLDICGVDTTDAKSAKKSQIWEFVLARLAGMKVDACTSDLKNCLADKDRCGADYSNCVGLSTEQVIKMCPYDKLLGCKDVYGEEIKSNAVYEKLYATVQGIILNIDNAMLAQCQAAVDAAAYRACGPDLDCAGLVDLNTIGATSLDYKICEYQIIGNDVAFTNNCHRDIGTIPDVDLGRVEYSKSGELGPVVPYAGVIDVPVFWETISVGSDGRYVGLEEYLPKLEKDKNIFLTDAQKERLTTALYTLRDGMKNIMDIIESDPTVKACMVGRSVDGRKSEKVGRFPNITNNMGMILAQKLLQRAKNNYYTKYDEFNNRQLQDYVNMVARQTEIRGENAKDKRREIARQSCVNLAEMSALPKSPEPPSGVLGGILIGIVLALAITAICVFTAGGGAAAIGAVAGTAGASLGSTAAGTTVTTLGLTMTVATTGTTVMGTTAAAAAAGITGIVAASVGGAAAIAMVGIGINDAIQGKNTPVKTSETFDTSQVHDYTGAYKITHWNYKEDITTIFDPIKLTCEKCVVGTHCEKTHAPMFGDQYCVEWKEPLPKTCTTIQF